MNLCWNIWVCMKKSSFVLLYLNQQWAHFRISFQPVKIDAKFCHFLVAKQCKLLVSSSLICWSWVSCWSFFAGLFDCSGPPLQWVVRHDVTFFTSSITSSPLNIYFYCPTVFAANCIKYEKVLSGMDIGLNFFAVDIWWAKKGMKTKTS